MKTLNPITTRNHDKAVASAHVKTKTDIIDQLQSFIQVATTHPTKATTFPLNEFLLNSQAKTPIKIAEETERYLSYSWLGSNHDYVMPGTDPENNIATFKSETAEYKTIGTYTPMILHHVQTSWGNGFSSQPTATKVNGRSKGLQQMIIDKRNEVLYDDKQRKSFIKSLETMDKTDPFYLAQKFILNPETLEGIHRQPVEQPKAVFTPYTETHPEPEPEPEQDQTPEPTPAPTPEPTPEPAPTPPAETPATPRKKVIPAAETIHIVEYSPKAIAVFGSTKQFKDEFLKIWGRWVPLTDPTTGTKKTAWVFSKKREAQVREIIKAA